MKEDRAAITAGRDQPRLLRFEWKGKDAYPLIGEKMKDPEVYQSNVVKFELLKYFGYWVTESSVHNAEYVAWFRKTPETCARYTPGYPPEFDWVSHHEQGARQRREALRTEIYQEDPLEIKRSHEYCISIIDSIVSNVPARSRRHVHHGRYGRRCPPTDPALYRGWRHHPVLAGAGGEHGPRGTSQNLPQARLDGRDE